MVLFIKRAAKFILISPVLLLVSILNFFFSFVTRLASAGLMIFSFLLGCGCLMFLFERDWINAGIAFVAAWLIPCCIAVAHGLSALLQSASCWLANKILD